MSHEAYRAPEAPLIGPGAPLEPRSPVVAVLLASAVTIALSVVLGVALGMLGLSSEEVARGPVAFVLSGGSGFLAGWIAARYRRGPWLGVTAAVVGLDVLLSGGSLALGLPGTVLQLAVSVTGDVAGGYTGRGWRAARPERG